MILAAGLSAFASGVLIEATAIAWVHFAERDRPIAAALASMIQATAQVIGIGESLHDWRSAPCFIIGYGAGTALAVVAKRGR